ncbi:hypothetical protein Cadr_000026958 [Camelus dromedarius]|uniref:Uncharacterized protein n=1 Tax=Camelus dromedarius TaxID=9838 RepID=A0A5N4C4L2_CAMDR|nr:hypothetical protein Cadr_000026958 [Camelus dromedarius]
MMPGTEAGRGSVVRSPAYLACSAGRRHGEALCSLLPRR